MPLSLSSLKCPAPWRNRFSTERTCVLAPAHTYMILVEYTSNDHTESCAHDLRAHKIKLNGAYSKLKKKTNFTYIVLEHDAHERHSSAQHDSQYRDEYLSHFKGQRHTKYID